jgi:aspartate carbamoyltransferase catalytic subunit
MRHPETESIAEIQRHLTVPLINAGNGTDQHPTQALVDWYTLLKWRPDVGSVNCPADKKIRIGVVGEPNTMRAVRSFLLCAPYFAPGIEEITIISGSDNPIEGAIEERLRGANIRVEFESSLTKVLPTLDAVYINSIALLEDGYHELASDYRLHRGSPLKKDAVILHPFARKGELDPSLDETPHNLYFAQAAGAVFIRQALLICVLGRLAALPGSVLYLAK